MTTTGKLGEFTSRTDWVLSLVPFLCVTAVILAFCTDALTATSVANEVSARIGFQNDDSASLFFYSFCGMRHIAAFIALSLASLPFLRVRTHGWSVALAACGGVALLSEIFQGLVTATRKPAVIDVCVDLIATAAGLSLLRLVSSHKWLLAWAVSETRFPARQAAASPRP